MAVTPSPRGFGRASVALQFDLDVVKLQIAERRHELHDVVLDLDDRNAFLIVGVEGGEVDAKSDAVFRSAHLIAQAHLSLGVTPRLGSGRPLLVGRRTVHRFVGQPRSALPVLVECETLAIHRPSNIPANFATDLTKDKEHS
jgi:hypothetical protein